MAVVELVISSESAQTPTRSHSAPRGKEDRGPLSGRRKLGPPWKKKH